MALAVQDVVLMVFLSKVTMNIKLQLHRPEKINRTITCNPMTLSTVGDVPRNGLRVKMHNILTLLVVVRPDGTVTSFIKTMTPKAPVMPLMLKTILGRLTIILMLQARRVSMSMKSRWVLQGVALRITICSHIMLYTDG